MPTSLLPVKPVPSTAEPVLTDDDRFVPQVGGLIIHIRDYVYTPEARPIYNRRVGSIPRG